MSRAGGCSHCLPPGFSPFVSVELHTNPRGRHSPLPKHPRQRCCRGCFLPFPPVGRRQSQCLAVLCHRSPGHGDALRLEAFHQFLVAVGTSGILLRHQLGNAGLDPLGREPLPHRPAKEPAQGKDPLAALQGLVSQRAAHRRGMQVQGCLLYTSPSPRD